MSNWFGKCKCTTSVMFSISSSLRMCFICLLKLTFASAAAFIAQRWGRYLPLVCYFFPRELACGATNYGDLQKHSGERQPFFLCTFQPRRGSLSHRLREGLAQPGRRKSSGWKEGFSRMPCERISEKTSRTCRCRHPFPRSYD